MIMNAETAVNNTETTVTPQEQQVATQESVSENTLTQDDVNRIVAERVAREKAKFEKKYSNVDVDHYKNLVEEQELRSQQELEKRGEYEKLLKDQAEKFQGKLHQYESELHTIKVDGALLNEASSAKAVNPSQVAALLKSQIKLNDAGAVDVVDSNGQVRYDESGNPLKVASLVNEFLTANPHFVSAGPNGSGTGQGAGKQASLVDNDVTKLDMSNPEHRVRYKEIMQAKGVRF
tara:strand:- start:675 stop:1376 length:702 start_codon:yes stop_codon:yes gene_type:complete